MVSENAPPSNTAKPKKEGVLGLDDSVSSCFVGNLAALAANPDCEVGNQVYAKPLAIRGIVYPYPYSTSLPEKTDFHFRNPLPYRRQ